MAAKRAKGESCPLRARAIQERPLLTTPFAPYSDDCRPSCREDLEFTVRMTNAGTISFASCAGGAGVLVTYLILTAFLAVGSAAVALIVS